MRRLLLRTFRPLIARALISLAVIVLALGIALASPAAAHGAESALSVVSADDSTPGSVSYRVRVVYQNDGEPVPGLRPTAVAVAPGGAESPPVVLSPTDVVGEYAGIVPVGEPGVWTVRFEVAEPSGSLVIDQTVAAPTTAVPPTNVPPTAEPATTSPTTTSLALTTIAPAAADSDSETSSGPGVAVVLIGAAIGVALVGLSVVVRRRRDRRVR